MSNLDVFKEFLSRTREWHAMGFAFMATYIGAKHAPLTTYTGQDIILPMVFGIGLMIIGVSTKTVRQICNNMILPEKAQLPDDIRKEWVYYWFGIFLFYFLKDFNGLTL